MNIKQNLRRTRALERTREVANYKHVHGRYPSQKAAIKKVSQLGVWLSNRRGILNGTGGSGTWYPECEILAKGLGCPDMFTYICSEEFIPKFIDRIGQIAEYKRKHGMYPPANNTTKKTYSKKVLKIGRWLLGMRAAKENKPNRTNEYIWFPIYEQTAISFGCAEMFEWPIRQLGNLKDVLFRTRRIAEYKKKYGKYPTSRSENGQPLAGWLCGMRRAKAGKLGKDDSFVWFDECEKLAEKLGCVGMFERKKMIRGVRARTMAIIQFKELYGKYPSTKDRNERTRQLGFWLRQMRQIKNGTRTGYTWYPECEQVALEMGDPDLFKTQVA